MKLVIQMSKVPTVDYIESGDEIALSCTWKSNNRTASSLLDQYSCKLLGFPFKLVDIKEQSVCIYNKLMKLSAEEKALVSY